MRAFACGVFLTCLATGCGSASQNQAISIDDVPKNLLEIAKEKLPDVTFDQAVSRCKRFARSYRSMNPRNFSTPFDVKFRKRIQRSETIRPQ